MRALSGVRHLDISGYFLAMGVAPIFVSIDDKEFLAIFSTEAQLCQSMSFLKVENYTIQKIDEGRDFLQCVWAYGIQVVLDPRPEQGNTRFTLLLPNTAQGTS